MHIRIYNVDLERPVCQNETFLLEMAGNACRAICKHQNHRTIFYKMSSIESFVNKLYSHEFLLYDRIALLL